MEITELLKQPGTLTVSGILIVIIVSGFMRKWVFGWVFVKEEKEKEFWRDQYLKQRDSLHSAVDLADQLLRKKIN